MTPQKEKFLRNEFLTMTILGAMGRSRTYSDSATPEEKNLFRNALREKIDHISSKYETAVTEEEHLSIIKNLSDDLTLQFSHCLRNARFRIGIAQKALNLYLKYLWCADLIEPPPHCPFDSIVITHLPECRDLNWTSIDSIDDYERLVLAARKVAGNRSMAEWESDIWLDGVQSERKPKDVTKSGGKAANETAVSKSFLSAGDVKGENFIIGTIVNPDKDRLEITINKKSSNALPHKYGQKNHISLSIGDTVYEAGVHETEKGVVWISSVLLNKYQSREKARLVDALEEIGLEKGHRIRIRRNIDGTFSLEPYTLDETLKNKIKDASVEKSPGFEKLASKFHDKLKEVMVPYKNKVLQTARIKEIIQKVDDFHGQEQWIYPSDHCHNHTNKGACYCALTKNALFEKITRGKYRVL